MSTIQRFRLSILCILALYFVGVFWAIAQAQTATIDIEYIAPTEYSDNSPINPGELAEWQLGCGLAPGDRSIVLDMWLDDGGMMHSGPVAAGNYFCAARVNATAAGLPGPGPYSDWSNEIPLSALPKPRPAILVAITVVAGS